MDPDDLYGLALDRFIPERGALVKQLRANKEREEAARVAALRKPSVAAWAVNQLVRTQQAAVKELFDAGDELRDAQSDLLSGEGDGRALRAAGDRERSAVEDLVERARGLLSSAGNELSAAVIDRVSDTLHAAALDEDAREQVRDGRLERELRHAGLGFGLGAGTAPEPAAEVRQGRFRLGRCGGRERGSGAKGAGEVAGEGRGRGGGLGREEGLGRGGGVGREEGSARRGRRGRGGRRAQARRRGRAGRRARRGETGSGGKKGAGAAAGSRGKKGAGAGERVEREGLGEGDRREQGCRCRQHCRRRECRRPQARRAGARGRERAERERAAEERAEAERVRRERAAARRDARAAHATARRRADAATRAMHAAEQHRDEAAQALQDADEALATAREEAKEADAALQRAQADLDEAERKRDASRRGARRPAQVVSPPPPSYDQRQSDRAPRGRPNSQHLNAFSEPSGSFRRRHTHQTRDRPPTRTPRPRPSIRLCEATALSAACRPPPQRPF